MELHRIQALDLRDPFLASVADATAEYDRRMNAIDRMWNWPVFPAKSAEFIETGIWPKWSTRSITVKFHVSTAKFNASLKRISDAIANTAMQVEMIDHLHGVAFLRDAKKPWYKRLWRASH